MAERPLPDLLLERYRLGELPTRQMRDIAARLQADPELRARLDALGASNEALLKAHAPEDFARRLGDRLRRERIGQELRREGHAHETGTTKTSATWIGSWGRPAFAGVLFLAVVSMPVWQAWKTMWVTSAIDERSVTGSGHPASSAIPRADAEANDAGKADGAASNIRGTGEGESRGRANDIVAAAEPGRADARSDIRSDIRLKGLEPALALFRKTADGSEPLRPGAKARPGDVLRIGYRASGAQGASYGAIYSVDGNGNVTRHWPSAGDRAVRLEPGEHLLPGAFELDAAPDYERFYLWVSDRAFALPPVSEALRGARPPAAADGIRVIRFDLLKDLGT